MSQLLTLLPLAVLLFACTDERAENGKSPQDVSPQSVARKAHPAQELPPNLILGFVDNRPAPYVKLAKGMVLTIEATEFAKAGAPIEVKQTVRSGSAEFVVDIVSPEPADGAQPTRQYSVRVDGIERATPSREAWAKTDSADYFALSLSDLGGVIYRTRSGAEVRVETEFSYDDFGRRQIAKQTISSDAGTGAYTISYTKYSFDRGRITGYTATVEDAPR